MDKGGIVQMAKLVAFYSRADENYFGGSMKYIQIGNTEKAAKMIADMTGADLFKIEQKIPYAADYNTCIAQAKEDKQTGKRPEILNLPQDIDQYDEIYLGYPNYREPCQWLYILFWKVMILQERKFIHSVRMKEADCQIRRVILKKCKRCSD